MLGSFKGLFANQGLGPDFRHSSRSLKATRPTSAAPRPKEMRWLTMFPKIAVPGSKNLRSAFWQSARRQPPTFASTISSAWQVLEPGKPRR